MGGGGGQVPAGGGKDGGCISGHPLCPQPMRGLGLLLGCGQMRVVGGGGAEQDKTHVPK
jgi:hypothetical protein